MSSAFRSAAWSGFGSESFAERIGQARTWIDERSLRERALLLAVCLGVLYTGWALLLMQPVRERQAALREEDGVGGVGLDLLFVLLRGLGLWAAGRDPDAGDDRHAQHRQDGVVPADRGKQQQHHGARGKRGPGPDPRHEGGITVQPQEQVLERVQVVRHVAVQRGEQFHEHEEHVDRHRVRHDDGQRVLVLASFTEREQRIAASELRLHGLSYTFTDLVTSEQITPDEDLILGPYRFVWLKAV